MWNAQTQNESEWGIQNGILFSVLQSTPPLNYKP